MVGLYLSPPESALVICVDEKSNIQALDRSTGYATSADHKLVRALESTYKRNGTLNLFAALDVATGLIYEKTTAPSKKTKKGFLEFLDELLSELPDSGEYHVIMDNHSIHKRHELWLDSHPNVFFHYTPTSASWLNMVEIWFGILTLKSLRGASFSTTQELGAHIKVFQDAGAAFRLEEARSQRRTTNKFYSKFLQLDTRLSRILSRTLLNKNPRNGNGDPAVRIAVAVSKKST